MNVPNLLSLLRILLIPVFIILIMDERFGWALMTFAAAGVTDGIDGLIARITHQKTELGAYLDPIADKLLLSSAFIVLAILQILPRWLTVIVITRDVIILVGFVVFLLMDKRPSIQPSLLSKMTTVLQTTTVLLALVRSCTSSLDSLVVVAVYGTMVLTILSGSHYIYVGTQMLNGKQPSPTLHQE